jgi:hypothetical protein
LGTISEIYTAYQKSLDFAQKDYEQTVRERSNNTKDFYDNFFKNLVMNFGKKFPDDQYRKAVIEQISNFFGKTELNFIAVDGSCDKHNANEFVSFYGGAYGSRGTLELSENPPKITYKKWEIEKDVSMVAFVPVPYSRLSEVSDSEQHETFLMRDWDKVDISGIHLPIMQLAEIFLAYNSAMSSNLDSPNIIFVDNNVSNILGYTDFSPDKIGLLGYEFATGNLSKSDAAVVQAHPFNSELGIPSTKIFSTGFAIIQFFHENPDITEISIDDLETKLGIEKGSITQSRINRLEINGIITFDKQNKKIIKKIDPYKSWERTKILFQTLCKEIFLDKRQDALKYKVNVDGKMVSRWMEPSDINFLIAIGVRALIETCWEKKIFLIGVIKDSGSQYLTRNYLGVCKLENAYPALNSLEVKTLPPTDRLFCETLPWIDDNLYGPWATIEFDSTFMTLHAEPRGSINVVAGTLGGITRPERLFMRSIGQFYVKRTENSILTGHAIFVDRLVFPELDGISSSDLNIDSPDVGKISPMVFLDNSQTNFGQIITYFLLDQVTKNHFPEVIGYPDPLHKADWGAKTMMRHVKELLKSSELKFRVRPLTNTFREIRESYRR